MRAVFCGLQCLDEADAGIHGTINAPGAFLGRVLQAEFYRVDLELFGQLVDDLLGGKGRLRGARGPIGLRVRLVVDDVVGFDPRVRQVVAAKDAHRSGADDAAGKSAAVVGHPGVASDESAVLFRAELDANKGAGCGAGPFEDFIALHGHFHGSAAFSAKQRGDRLEIDDDLSAEAAADLARYDDDLRNGNLQQLGDLLTGVERALRRAPNLQAAVFVPHGDGGVRLDVALMHAGGAKFALDDYVRLLEAVVGLALLKQHADLNIGRLVTFLSHLLGA